MNNKNSFKIIAGAFLLAIIISMILVVIFSLPRAAKVGDRDKFKKDVIMLCKINAVLADKLHAELDKREAELDDFSCYPRNFYNKNDGSAVGVVPTANFFLIVAELIRRDKKVDIEVVRELIDDNQSLISALENENDRKIAVVFK